MFGKTKMVRLQPHAVQRIVSAVVVILVAVFAMMPAASAGACAKGETAAATISIVHKAEFEASVTAPDSIAKLGTAYDCCGKGRQGGDCSTGHCFACSAALSTPISNFAINSAEIGHVWPGHSALVVADPAPDFRPPRVAA